MLLGRLPQAVLEHLLELLQHRLLDHDVLVVQVVDDVLVAALGVDVDDYGLDRRVALDEDTCRRGGRELDWRWLRSFSRLEGQAGGGGDAYLEWHVLAWCRTVKDHRGDGIRVLEESVYTGGTEELQVLGVAKFNVLLVMTPKLALLVVDLSPA